MNIKKRIVSALMALVMTLSLVNSAVITAFAEGTQTTVPSTGETQTGNYELRVLTFEDADYKGGTNFAGKSDWSSLIDDPQYGGSMLYPDGSGTTDESKAYTWYDAGNTELKHTLPKSWDNYCYWGGGHAVSNYASGEFTTYGSFNSQLTVYKKDVTDLVRTGGGHNGSNNFAVHFGYKDDSGYTDSQILPSFSFGDGVARVIDHMYVNNICYALNCYLNGNGQTAKIGDDDWVKLTATGYNGETKTGETSIYLCNGPKNIIMDWTKFDLSGLDAVTKVEFNITGSSDNGYGFSQPAYFAYDDVAVRFEKPCEHVDANKDKKCDTCGADLNQPPVLAEGVTDKTVTIQTGKSYQLDDLMDGKIFTDPDDKLTYKNYFYQISTDDGATWSEAVGFEEALFGGVEKSLSQSKAGKYVYRFYAVDSSGARSESYWTLTINFSDVITENINFYVGRDQNYDTNGNIYPLLKLYKTAGIDEKQFDYVGWFTNGEGKTEYIYNPAAYTIDTTGETNYVVVGETKYELHDYEEITFTNSAFDAAAEGATASNTVVNNYNMFYATLSTGRYSTRAYGWNTETEAYDIYLGGQSMPLPMEKDIYGGGGNDIYLGIVSVYANTKNEKNEYFTADDYYVEMIMPVTGSMIHAGTPYEYVRFGTIVYTAYPFLSFEAGNGSLYNIYAYPKDTEKYMFNQAINLTTNKTYNVTTKSISISEALELKATVPANAEFDLYFQYNNFNTKPVTPLGEPKTNDDGTKTFTYRISKGNSNYTWRLTDPSGKYVTKAGWLASTTATMEKTFTFGEDAATDKKTHDTSKLGTTVSTRDEADIQVFLDHSGFMSVSDTYRVRAFRMWQLIDSDTANIMVEPEFNVQMLQGSKDDVKQVNGGNAVGNWIDVTPTGTDIIAVTYDAIDMYATDGTHKTHGGLFPATAPERTGVFVITNEKAGSADAVVRFNGGTTSSRGAEWDYNYDTWYYLDTDKAPTLDFTVTAGAAVSYAVVTTDASLKSTLSDWTDITADADGVYHAGLLKFRSANTLGGTVIIKMTDATGTSYRLVRVAQMSVTVKNASNAGEPIMPGDKVTLSFDGLYRGMDKVSGVFNPTTLYGNYSAGEDGYKGTLSQYQQMDRTSITLTVPEDITFPEGESVTNYLFTDGYISGGMYAASSPFDTMYNMTDTGVGTNFSAVSISFVASRLADVSVEVAQKVWYNVELSISDEAGKVEGATVVLKGSDGKAIAPQEDGTYKLGYGSYTYSVVKNGYVCYNASFKLGSADAASVQDGKLVKAAELTKAAEGAWDGKTATEPAKDANGVYQISNGAELAWFAQQVNSGKGSIAAVLTNDIDLAAYEWTTIGNSSKKFAGSFDGQGHKVFNLSINYAGTNNQSPYKGLFGYVNGSGSKHAEIKNLTVQGNVVLTSNKNVSAAYSGGVIGRADYADITNVHSEVNVTVNRVGGNWDNLGGLVGYANNSTTIKDCSNSGTIKGWRYAGGITGNLSNNSSIINCFNTGVVTNPSTCAAGIVANLGSGCKVIGCYNTGAITAGGNYAAGIVGYCGNSEVSNCYNAGKITCNPAFTYGSVIGTVTNASAVIKNLYYLEGTCDKGGIGSVQDEQTQTASSVTAEELKSADFVDKMNTELSSGAFIKGTSSPLLNWQIVASVVAPETIEAIENGTNVTYEIYMNAASDLACAQMKLNFTGNGEITEIKPGSDLALGDGGSFTSANNTISFIGNTASAANGILVATVTVRVDAFADEVKLTVSDAVAGISGNTADKAVSVMNADVEVEKVYTVSESEFAPGLYLVTYIKAVPEGKSITCNGEGMLLADGNKTVTLMSGDKADALKNSSFAVSDGAAVAVKYGDVNENSKINIVDAQIALDVGKGIYKGSDKVSVAGLLAADVNHDNVVNATDAYSIQIYVHYSAFTVPAGN